MEVIPVEDVTDEQDGHGPAFVGCAIKRYALADPSDSVYRVFLVDGSYHDVKADNASHAFQLVQRQDIARIVNVAYAHDHILDEQVLQPSDEPVIPAIEQQDQAEIIAEFGEKSDTPFEVMGLAALAESYREEEQQQKTATLPSHV